MAVQSTPIICIVFLKFLNLPNFKDFFIDFFEKNDLHVVSDLNFFLAWFENEYYIYQLRSKGYILSIYTSPWQFNFLFKNRAASISFDTVWRYFLAKAQCVE